MATVAELDAIILKIEQAFGEFTSEAKDRRKSDSSVIQSSQTKARVKSNEVAKLLKEFRNISKAVKSDKSK